MENFVALIIMAAFLSVAGYMVVRNVRSGSHAGEKARAAPLFLLGSTFLLLCDMTAGEGLLLRLPFDLLLSVLAAFSLNSVVIPLRESRVIAFSVCLAEILAGVYYLSCACGCLCLPSGIAAMSASAMAAIFIAVAFLYGISCRIRDIGSLLASGNAFDMLGLGTDAAYVVSFLAGTICMLVTFSAIGMEYRTMAVFPVLFGAGLLALDIRLFLGSFLIVARRHESRIAGALKVPGEICGPKQASSGETYRDIYTRIVLYFEEEKPYLNGDLTINDVVKGVYTNKLYISKAISQYAGKNFCQFVNYYRVMHSIETYRLNPEMRVADMWQSCGFNSIVSYNMAFKLFMGENPSDWCRKEKARLVKCKK